MEERTHGRQKPHFPACAACSPSGEGKWPTVKRKFRSVPPISTGTPAASIR